MASAAARASATVCKIPVPRITGRPPAAIFSLRAALSLRASMLSGEGPMNTSPFRPQRAANPAFSDRKP